MAANDIATTAEFLAMVEDASGVGPRASGTITVAIYPVPAATTVTLGSLVLTATDGTPTSGANQFKGNDTDAATVAANIAAAISDAANSWASAGVTATASAAIVSVLGNRGPDGDVALVSSDASITVVGLTGGDTWIVHALNTFAANFLDPLCWGDWLNHGSIYLAAHFLSQLPSGIDSSPQATSINIGSISKSFAVAAPMDSQFGSTAWGKLYLLLADRVLCQPGGVAGSGGDPLGVIG